MARLETDPIACYRANRKPHYHAFGAYQSKAVDAWRAAKYTASVHRRWLAAESAGLVRLEIESDSDPCAWENYFDGDTYCPKANPDYPGGARALAAEKKRAVNHLESWGLVVVSSHFRTDPDGRWEIADSIGGIEGDADPRIASGYGPDLMASALSQLRDMLRLASRKRVDLRRGRCPHCHGTGRA